MEAQEEPAGPLLPPPPMKAGTLADLGEARVPLSRPTGRCRVGDQYHGQ